MATLSYGMSSSDLTVPPKEVDATVKSVSQLENDRIAQKKTLQECNAKLANNIEKVTTIIKIILKIINDLLVF